LFSSRDFALLWIGQLFSQIGDQCLLIAAMTLITGFSRSPLAMLIPAISIAAPQLVFGLAGGVIADRWDRKKLMIASEVLRGLIVLAVLLVRSVGDLWILYLAAACLTLVGVFFYPARNAVIPNVVPPGLLLAANGLIQGSYIVALIVGPVVAGTLVELWAPAAILFDSLSFFVSAILITVMNIPDTRKQPRKAKEDGVWEDMKAGLNFIRRNRAVRQVLVTMAVATLGIGAVVLLAIPHLKERLEAGGLMYGGAMSMLGVGSVLGGLLVSRLSRRLSASTLVGGLMILAGIAIVAFAWAPTYWVVLISVAVLGMSVVVARGALETIVQTLTPDEVRGRVQSATNLLVVISTTLAQGLSAVLGALLGVQSIFVAAGVLTALTGAAATYILREAAHLVGKRWAIG
jgi:MFS family permease